MDTSLIWCKHDLRKMVYQPLKSVPEDVHTLMPIECTIHFQTIQTDDFKLYSSLLECTHQPEHSVEIFKNLIAEFDESKIGKIQILYSLKHRRFMVQDGVHRLAILLSKGVRKIPLSWLDIQYDAESVQFVKNRLQSTVCDGKYNGWSNRIPYQSIQLGKEHIRGQRTSHKRVEIMRQHVDFTDKYLVDFGCNLGGTLLHIPEAKKCVGFDYDAQCVDVGNTLAHMMNVSAFFHVHDFDKHSNEVLKQKTGFPDLIILTAMGSWVKSWRNLYGFCVELNVPILFETNNDKEGEPQLQFFRDKKCDLKCISQASTDDTTGNHLRKLYIVKRN